MAPGYLKGSQCVVAVLSAKFPGKICRYRPDGGKPVHEMVEGGTFIDLAVFSVGPLGNAQR